MQTLRIIKLAKISVLIFMGLTFLNILLPDEFVIGIANLGYKPSTIQMLIRWLNYVSFLVLPIAIFFDKRIFKKLAIYFCLPIALLMLLFAKDIIAGYISELGTGICDIRYLPIWLSSFMKNKIFRAILFYLISLTQIFSIILVYFIDIKKDKTIFSFDKYEKLLLFTMIVLLSISIIPTYALEGIFGTYTNYIFKAYSSLHYVWIIILISEVIIFTILFKNKSYEDKYILVLILALSLLIQFSQLFSTLGELTCKRMPLQLCNIASYTILISIVFKKRGLFLFNILVNVAGGIIALLVMDVEGDKGILYWSNIHYIVEHNNVILVPLLCLILGIFEPLEKKDFKLFIIYFTSYYMIVYILGTLFNTLYTVTGSNYFYCNYLFMFDQETAARLVGFAGKLFDIKLSIGPVTLYPVVQILIYIAFFIIGTITFIILKTTVKKSLINK